MNINQSANHEIDSMKTENSQILIATRNEGKVKELQILLADAPLRLRSLNEFENIIQPAETGETFAENAAIKARSYALQTGLCALADDSGLEVEALNGAPGVYSARYGGGHATDYQQKINFLLQEIQKTESQNRRARFLCAIAFSDEFGKIRQICEGVCNGSIALTSQGQNGFGYDPIFIPDGFDRTFGELSANIKQQISHRQRAIEKIIRFLHGFIAL